MNEYEILQTFAMNEQVELEKKINLLNQQLTNDNITKEQFQKKSQELNDLIAMSIAMQYK